MKKNHKLFILTILFFSTILFCLQSCALRAEQKSLTTQFDTVDALIFQNQMRDAIKELKKIEKQVYDSWAYIGVFKRYSQIGENELAEKILKKALKKNETNIELKTVYANFLLRNNRIDEAVKLSKGLQGTKYGSLYSEAILRQAQNSKNVSEESFYREEQFYQIYFDAYNGSRNTVWLRNCAVFDLTRGLFDNASSLNPNYYADSDDAYFWSLVLFDSGHYYDAINAIDVSRKFMNDTPDKTKLKVTDIKLAAIEADSYLAVSDADSAEASRQLVVSNIDNLNIRSSDESMLPVIMVNSAIYAQNNSLDDQCADLLFYTVNRWPDFVPALILYADFAFASNKERQEDKEIEALRKNGIKTLEMERYDNRRKIPLSDAVYRIEESLKRKSDPYLYIAKLDLKYKLDTEISVKEKTTDLWTLLEDNYDESEKYNTLLIQYSINYLLDQKLYDDAWKLFVKYCIEHCKIDEKQDFWKQFIEQMRIVDLSIVEQAAWFATDLQKTDEALRLYEYCVYESSGLQEEGIVSPAVSTASCMNLANIYYSTGKKDKALDLYGKAAGRESNAAKRSEIFYRIASIYVSVGDIKNALRSADYACSLYPENARAALLKDKLTIQ